MDACKIKRPGTPTRQKIAQVEDHGRRPLVPSEKNNAVPATGRARTRDSTSRPKPAISSTPTGSPSKPRRSPSPVPSHASQLQELLPSKRAQSAERRRPSTPQSSRPSTPSSPSSRSTTPVRDTAIDLRSSSRRLLSSRAPDGLWPSIRSLSSSFQSESVLVSVKKRGKVVASSSSDETTSTSTNQESERKKTPLRGRNTIDQSENSRPLENSAARAISQHRWPGSLGGRLSANVLSRSVDLADKASTCASLSAPSRGASPKRMPAERGIQRPVNNIGRQLSIHGSEIVERERKSDASSLQPSGRSSYLTRPSRTQASPKRIPMVNGADKGLHLSASEQAKQLAVDPSKRPEQETELGLNCTTLLPTGRSSSVTRPSRGQSLPSPVSLRSSSPNRALSTPSSTSRGLLSPSRTRPSTPTSPSGSTISRAGANSAFNYFIDIRRGKDPKHAEDHHQLRLTYNATMQWHFVNARAEENLSIQKIRAENMLYNMWHLISKMRDSVLLKKIAVQHLRQESKLGTILNEQIQYLSHWVSLEREHGSSLSGAIEALKASTLRLPVTGGARADVFSLKNAVSSAVDVMQAMGSSVCYLLSKVDGMMSLVSELSAVAAKERGLLDECRELLAFTAAMQESSLRTHLLQLRQDAHKLEYPKLCNL